MKQYTIFALLVVIFLHKTIASSEQPNDQLKYSSLSFEFIYGYISQVTLGWRSEHRSKKAESQKQVLFNDSTGRAADIFFEAVKDINDVFGYQKLVPQLSTKVSPKEQAIVIYFGPKSEGRKLLREAAGRSQAIDDAWDGWFWWDDSEELSKSVIAIYQEQATPLSLAYYLRRSLLTALGYPGYTYGIGSIFDVYSSRYPQASTTQTHDKGMISMGDRGILRFCDRFLSTDANRADFRQVIIREWPAFASTLDAQSALEKNAEQSDPPNGCP